MSETVNGSWEVWGVEHFVDEFMAGTKFGQPSAILLNLQPVLDITKVISIRSGIALGLLSRGIQQDVMSAIASANMCDNDARRREVLANGIEHIFKKYGLSKEV